MQRNRGKQQNGKSRDLFKEIRDTKGTFHAKMSTIKDRNGMDLTEAQDIKERWQEYTEELYRKDHHNPDNHDAVTGQLNNKNILFCSLVAKSCPTLCDPMDYNPPGSSVHEILQARILEWVVISFSRGSS